MALSGLGLFLLEACAGIALLLLPFPPRTLGRGFFSLHGGLAAADSEYDLKDRHCLLNPGSVGQPRDRDPRAAWLVLDLEARSAHFRRSEYDIARTQAEIREAGLPERLAERLSSGV